MNNATTRFVKFFYKKDNGDSSGSMVQVLDKPNGLLRILGEQGFETLEKTGKASYRDIGETVEIILFTLDTAGALKDEAMRAEKEFQEERS